MTPLKDGLEALNARGQLPRQRIAELRSTGMHAIRFQLVVRLLHGGLREDTVSIFWDHSPQSLVEAPFGEAKWRLVLGRGSRNTVEVPDLWVLCYPDDPEIRRSVDAALDRIVERARRQNPGGERPRLRQGAVAKGGEARRGGAQRYRTGS
jgi:hypothetical protein